MSFDLQAYRKSGFKIVKGFFEPDIRERFAALGLQIGEQVESGAVKRDHQFMSGLDVDAAAHVSDSAALRAVVQDILGPEVCWLVSRVLMKDRNFRGAIEVHQDWPYFGGDTRKLNVFVPLTRCRRENGMIIFFEGSHSFGPVERGAIDIARYPQFAPTCPDLEVGDVLFADFLTWHSSVPAIEDDDRILLQVVLQPASDRSSNHLFGQGVSDLGEVNPRRTTPMFRAMPSIGMNPARELYRVGEVEEALRMLRGLHYDSKLNAEALLLLHEIAVSKGEDGSAYLAEAEAALAALNGELSTQKALAVRV